MFIYLFLRKTRQFQKVNNGYERAMDGQSNRCKLSKEKKERELLVYGWLLNKASIQIIGMYVCILCLSNDEQRICNSMKSWKENNTSIPIYLRTEYCHASP